MQERAFLPRPPDFRDLRGRSKVALFLDFDGTLVDLAPTPDTILVPASLSSDLHLLAEKLGGRAALVSGRAISDLERHLGSVSLAVAGSHGADYRNADGSSLGNPPVGLDALALREIEEFSKKAGFSLENKPHGAALHYRHDIRLEADGLEFAAAFVARHALELKRGKCVIEFVAPGANKGTAVKAFMDAHPFTGSVPIFVGDDVTDEDGFEVAHQLGGFGILVGNRPNTCACYRLNDPQDLYEWLEL